MRVMALLMMALMLPAAQASNSEQEREKIQDRYATPWQLNSPPYDYQDNERIDSDPRTRANVARFLSHRAGTSLSKLSTADRVHVLFSTGSDEIPDVNLAPVQRYIAQMSEEKHFFIVGFTDDQGEYDYNEDLAQNRANALKEKVQAQFPNASVQVYTSAAWLNASGTSGRRAEIWAL